VGAYRANALFDAHKDDPGFGHRVARRQGPRRRRSVVGSHGVADGTMWRMARCGGWHDVADRVEQQLVVRVREETGAAMARSPGSPVQDDLCAVTDKDERNRARAHRRGPKPALAHRHHRTPNSGGKALALRDQGRVHQQDRRDT